MDKKHEGYTKMHSLIDLNLNMLTEQSCQFFFESSESFVVNLQNHDLVSPLEVVQTKNNSGLMGRIKKLMVDTALQNYSIKPENVLEFEFKYAAVAASKMTVHFDVIHLCSVKGEVISNCSFEFVKTTLD